MCRVHVAPCILRLESDENMPLPIGFPRSDVFRCPVMHVHMTIFWTIVLGIIGSIIGGAVTHMFSHPRNERFHPAGLIFSTLGRDPASLRLHQAEYPFSPRSLIKFQKRGQLFLRSHDETLPVIAMRISNPDRSPVGIHGCG